MKLYKYYSLSSFSKKVLTDQEIYFSSFKQLNDPFEIAVNYTFDCDEHRKFDYFSRNHPTFSSYPDEGKRNHIKSFEDVYRKSNSRLTSMLRDSFKTTGIFCVSENPFDVLMWSHYAGKHRGFCVEFDTDKDPIFEQRFQVKYVPSMHNVVFYDDLIVRDVLDKKFDCWTYEKEWRIAKPQAGSQKINPDSITAIYQGPLNRFRPTTYDEKGAVKDPDVFGDAAVYFDAIDIGHRCLPNAKFFQLKMHPSEYKIERI